MLIAPEGSLYIDGIWSKGPDSVVRTDRWTGSAVGTMTLGGEHDASSAVDAATKALEKGLDVPARSRILVAAADLLETRSETFARTIEQDMGKPITAARLEVARAVNTLRYSSEEARRLPGERVPLEAVPGGQRTIAVTMPEALGVVAAVTPFNFPVNLVVHKVGPALAAGCPVVLKPSDKAPLAAVLLAQVFEEAGLPPGWLNVVTGPAEPIVGAWLDDPRVAALTFTGSASVGWSLKARAPQKLHVLELGSNTAMVVDRTADLEKAAADAVTAAMTNSGQACISLQRLYVDRAVASRFTDLLAAGIRSIAAGDPSLDETVVGPLVTTNAADRVDRWISDALESNAESVVGGSREGDLIAPTLLTSVAETSPLLVDEVFGPVVTVVEVDGADEALRRVNDSRFALNASYYTRDLPAALEAARRVQAGSVLVNLPPSFRADHMPYGGVKESGQGREGVRYAVEEFVHQKLVVLGA